MSGFNKFAGEGQGKFIMLLLPKKKVKPLLKKKLVPSEKVTPIKEVEKGTNILNYMEAPVHTIHRNSFDNFQGQSTGSTSWFYLDREWLKESFNT